MNEREREGGREREGEREGACVCERVREERERERERGLKEGEIMHNVHLSLVESEISETSSKSN